MSGSLRRIAGAVVAVAVVGATGALSRLPYDAGGDDEARLRLSWRVRGERVEACRPLTESERESLPAHMRREEVCEGRINPYLLQVHVDGEIRIADTVRASGAREDRPIYVHRELEIRPGAHEIRIRFVRLGEAGGEADRGGAGGEPAAPSSALGDRETPETPEVLVLDRALSIPAGAVALVTYDPEARRLTVVR